MPTGPTTNIPHAALTDHRLRKRPELADGDSGPLRISAWREGDPSLQTRNLALAEIFIGISKRAQAIGEDGLQLLEKLPSDQVNNDPAVLSDMEGLAMEAQDLPTALEMGRRSVELQPNSAKAAMNYGLVMKRSGDLAGAEREIARATQLDPALKQAFLELTMLYVAEQKPSDALATMDRYLKFNPQDILFRLQRAKLAGQH
jgi:Flp pilus assembly protein TadD